MPCLKNSLSLYFFFLTFKFLYTLCFCSLWHHFTVNVEPLPPRCILMCLIIPVHNSLPHINYSTKRHYYHSCENLWFFLYIQIYSDCNVTNFSNNCYVLTAQVPSQSPFPPTSHFLILFPFKLPLPLTLSYWLTDSRWHAFSLQSMSPDFWKEVA